MSTFFSLLLILILPVLIIITILVAKHLFEKKSRDEIIEEHKKESTSVFIKKYKEADLEYYRGLFLRLGFVFSLGFILLAFSWTKRDEIMDLQGNMELPDEIEIEPPQTQQPPPPPPPPPPPELEIVDDEDKIEEDVEIEEMDIDEDTKIDIPDDIPEEETTNEAFMRVEEMPEFPGGEAALIQYLGKVTYPQLARDNDIEGTVFVEWIVDKSGKVTDVKILKGADPILDEAAMKHVKNMPKWKPGKQRGKPVRVIMRAPIRFKIVG